MERVTGIGGIFFKAKDTKALAQWYQQHLGIVFAFGTATTFKWINHNNPGQTGQTAFSFFKEDSPYFSPSEKQFMVNFRVKDLVGLLEILKQEGVEVVGEMQEYNEYGKFGWILDPEGNKVELWEPADEKD